MDDGGTRHQEMTEGGKDQVWEEDAEGKLAQAEVGVGQQGGKSSRSGAKRWSLLGGLGAPGVEMEEAPQDCM